MGITPEIGVGIFSFVFGIIYLSLFALSIYLMVTTIKFFKNKTQNDTELLEKLDTLIKMMSQQGNDHIPKVSNISE